MTKAEEGHTVHIQVYCRMIQEHKVDMELANGM